MTQKTLQTRYPNIAAWVEDDSIEIGTEYGQGIVARAIDGGETVWEGNKFKNLTEAMDAMEQGMGKWCEENYVCDRHIEPHNDHYRLDELIY